MPQGGECVTCFFAVSNKPREFFWISSGCCCPCLFVFVFWIVNETFCERKCRSRIERVEEKRKPSSTKYMMWCSLPVFLEQNPCHRISYGMLLYSCSEIDWEAETLHMVLRNYLILLSHLCFRAIRGILLLTSSLVLGWFRHYIRRRICFLKARHNGWKLKRTI